MRCSASLLLLLTIIIGCSKKNTERSNFVELKVGGQKFFFDSLEAILDTSAQGITCNFSVYDRASHSNMIWEVATGSEQILGTYKYPGELFPGRSLVYLHLQTYINQVPGTYTAQYNAVTMSIYQFGNGRIRGSFSGKMICYTCTPYGTEVDITDGEFEMPYSYR